MEKRFYGNRRPLSFVAENPAELYEANGAVGPPNGAVGPSNGSVAQLNGAVSLTPEEVAAYHRREYVAAQMDPNYTPGHQAAIPGYRRQMSYPERGCEPGYNTQCQGYAITPTRGAQMTRSRSEGMNTGKF